MEFPDTTNNHKECCSANHGHHHDTDLLLSTNKTKAINMSAIMQLTFLVAAIGFLIEMPLPVFKSVTITFTAIVLEAVPFILIGVLLSGLIEVFLSREKITSILPKNHFLTILMAAGLGLIFPVCECAIVPVIRRLLKKGIPISAAIAYLLGGPIVNPLVVISTAVAYSFSWHLVIMRITLGYIVAVAVGITFRFIMGKHEVLIPDNNFTQPHCEHCTPASDSVKVKVHHAVLHAAEEFYDIARFLIMGAFIAAVLQTLVPRSLFTQLNENPILAIILMMVLALVLNLCSEADAFVAASFKPTGMPLAAQMAFMVLGPMLDIKLILMYLSVFRIRAIIVLSILTAYTVFAAIYLLQLFIL